MISGDTQPVGGRVIRASLMVGLAHLLFKLAGFIQAMVLGRYLGDAHYAAIVAFAFENCIFAIFLIGEKSIGPAFLPLFVRQLDEKDESAAWNLANVVMTFQLFILLGIVFFLMRDPGSIVRLVMYWNPVDDPEKIRLAEEAIVGLAPALICLSLGSTTYMILNGYKRFFLAACGDASWKLCVVVCAVVGMGLLGMGYEAVIFGLVLGSVAKLVTHVIGLGRKAKGFRLSLSLSNPLVKTLLLLMLPLLIGAVFARVREVYTNVTLPSYLRDPGLLKALSIGRKPFTTVGWLVPYAISIAMFPFFCELVDRNDRDRFGQLLTQAGRMLLSIFVPLSLVALVLARPATFLLFHGGQFTTQTAEWTWIVMACYMLVFPAYALEYLLMQAFFAHRRMWIITFVGVFFSVLTMAASYVGVIRFGATGATALIVVTLAFVLGRSLKTGVLMVLLKRNVTFLPVRETAGFLVRVVAIGVVASGCAGVAVWGFEAFVSAGYGKLVLLAKLGLGGSMALGGFFLGTKLFRVKEPGMMIQWTMAKLRKRRAATGDENE